MRSFELVDRNFKYLYFVALAGIGFCALVSGGINWIGIAKYLALFAMAFWTLNGMGFFRSFKPMPRKSDAFVLVVVITSLGLIFEAFSKNIWNPGEGAPVWSEWIVISTLVAVGLIYQFGTSFIFLSRPKKKKIYAALGPDEFRLVKQTMDELDLSSWYEWVELNENPELILISRIAVRDFGPQSEILKYHIGGVPMLDWRDVLMDLTKKISLKNTDLWTFLNGATAQNKLVGFYFKTKYLTEPIVAIVFLVLLSPIILLLSLIIKLESKGPVFFKQIRSGHKGKSFYLYKFRSMRELTAQEKAEGPKWAKNESDRIGWLGRFLRATHLDEIPQLINIARGEMSFIGPRPERPEFYKIICKEIPEFQLRTMIKPGVTGWAQLHGGYAASVQESLEKLEYDLYYMRFMSPRVDTVIMLKTLLMFLRGKDEKAA